MLWSRKRGKVSISPLDQVTMIDTLPFGHWNLAKNDIRVTMMEINVDSDDDGEEETKEFEHPPVEVEVIVVKSDDDFQV